MKRSTRERFGIDINQLNNYPYLATELQATQMCDFETRSNVRLIRNIALTLQYF